MQQRLPQYEVVNYGVGGYGTAQSLIQLRDALEACRIPTVVVMVYASFHDARNSFSRSRRKEVTPWKKLGPLRQPYARLGHDGKLSYSWADVEYSAFPLMRYSALAHFVEIQYNRIEEKAYHSHDVSKALFLEIAALAKKYEFELVIAGITRDRKTRDILRFAQEHRIATAVDISVDLKAKGNRNLPHDVHPSPVANIHYADRLEAFLRNEVLSDGAPEAGARSLPAAQPRR